MGLAAASLLVGCKVRQAETQREVDEPPERVVSFSPALTEIVLELGAADALVGVSTFESHPDLPPGLPRVGGMADPNLELLVALEPQLVLTTPSVAQVEAFVEASLPEARVVSQEVDSLAELEAAYGVVGRGLAADAETIAAATARLRTALGPARAPGGPRVLLVVGRDAGSLAGLVAAGPGTFLDEVLVRAGGQNALPADAGAWPQLGIEGIIAVDPARVIELYGVDAVPPDARAVWTDALPELAASDTAVALSGSHLLLPGPRVVDTLAALRRALAAPSPQ